MNEVRQIESTDPTHREYHHEKRLQAIEKRISVSTNDDAVRRQLRELGQLAEIAHETRPQRRQRLARFLANQELIKEDSASDSNPEKALVPPPLEIERASSQLIAARERISRTSRPTYPHSSLQTSLADLDLTASQTGFGRPVAVVRLLNDKVVAVADYAGELSLLDLDSDMDTICKDASTNAGRIGDVATHEGKNFVVTGDISGNSHLFTFDGSQLKWESSFHGHSERITSMDVHHTGDFLISASHDSSWRLWDIALPDHALLEQDGHSGGINAARLSADGCVVATGGLDKDVRIWDLRNGIPVAALVNHPSEVYALTWNPNIDRDYELVSAGADNRCLVWDLRNPKAPTKVIYAHLGAIADIAFNGEDLVTTAFDETVKVWKQSEGFALKRKHNTGTRMMSVAVSPKLFITGRWDRQVDLYL